MVIKRYLIIASALLFLCLIAIAVHVETTTSIHENMRFLGTSDEVKSVSSARRGRIEYAAEAIMSEEYFLKKASMERWNIQRIGKYLFKIIRYTSAKMDAVSYRQQVLNDTIEDESSDKAYHYIKEGYYCIHETSKYGFYHIGYDTQNKTMYTYHFRRGMGPYKEIDMNPDFYKK